MDKKDSISWDLLEKSFRSELTSDEEKQLLDWLNSSEKHCEFYNSVMSGGEDVIAGLSDDKLARHRSEFRKLYRLSAERKLSNRRRLVYYTAAAVVLILMGLAGGNNLGNIFKSQKNTFGESIELAKNINPGKSKAILILGDGREIEVDDNNATIDAGAAKIVTNGGELSYDMTAANENKHTLTPAINKLKIPKGGEYILMLADGSRIWLNSESVIEYSIETIKDKREVFLRGEAYFDVAKDPARPFIVKTDDFTVRVIGTTFNINSYEDERSSNIAVETGNVEVFGESGEIAMLSRNQQLSINRTTREHAVKNVDIEAVIAWKNGYFDFEMEPLETIAKKISRWYAIDVDVKSEVLARTRFSGRIIKYENAAKILELLTLTGDITYEIKDNKIILSPSNSKN